MRSDPLFTEGKRDVGLLILRVALGLFMFYGHGMGKVGRLFGDDPISFADPFGLGPTASLALAAFAEALCSLLVVLGWWTRWALIPLIITMTVACTRHWGDGFGQMEKALLYLFGFMALFFAGPGRYSLDYWRSTNR